MTKPPEQLTLFPNVRVLPQTPEEKLREVVAKLRAGDLLVDLGPDEARAVRRLASQAIRATFLLCQRDEHAWAIRNAVEALEAD